MTFKLPPLPYSKDALAPHISAETLEFHYGKHHQGYLNKLNAAVEQDATLRGKSLEDIVRTAKGGLFNNAAQTWNHTFYWSSMSPNGGGEPRGEVAKAIEASFGSFADFKEKFSTAAAGQFGSGWAWVVKNGDRLAIETTSNADTPIAHGGTPVLTCDVWEHAYYIDYRNDRAKYIQAWWNVINWDFVAENLRK